MKRRIIIIAALVLAGVAVFVLRRHPPEQFEQPTSVSSPQTRSQGPTSARRYNAVGDILTDAQDPVFTNQVFPKFGEFVALLERLGVNPLQGELQSAMCSKVQIIQIPDGFICRFVIADRWTATYLQNQTYSGMMHFGQRGADDPIRAISHSDTNTLRRLSQGAITMPEVEIWKLANRLADAFGIDSSYFEKPEMFEEGLFDYRLGIYTVRYRKKGTDPVNQLNYTRDFSLRATSPTTAVLVSYSRL